MADVFRYYLQDVQDVVEYEVERDLGDHTYEDLLAIAIVGLAEEAGEVSGLLKRELRAYEKDIPRCTREKYIEELGDVLWYLAMACAMKGTDLDEVWRYNRNKLKERYG